MVIWVILMITRICQKNIDRRVNISDRETMCKTTGAEFRDVRGIGAFRKWSQLLAMPVGKTGIYVAF